MFDNSPMICPAVALMHGEGKKVYQGQAMARLSGSIAEDPVSPVTAIKDLWR